MVKDSLISCVEILYSEKIISNYERKKLTEEIRPNRKTAYDTVSQKLQKLAEKVYREIEK